MGSAVCNGVVALLQMAKGRKVHSCELRTGDRFYIGSDETSDVRLTEEGIAPTHCSISVGEGVVTVADCYSEQGTYVNGQRIRSETLSADATIQIGEARLAIKLMNPSSEAQSAASPTGAAAGEAAAERIDEAISKISEMQAAQGAPQDPVEYHAGGDGSAPEPQQTAMQSFAAGLRMSDLPESELEEEHSASDASEESSPNVNVPDVEELALQLLQAHEEIRVLQKRLEKQAAQSGDSDRDPYQDEMVDLLREEIIQLQAALAEREDAFTDTSSSPAHTEEMLPREDAEKLVDRLEQLLTELSQKDEQIDGLTNLLRVAEEAGRAEKEERSQIDGWLRDIEERFGQREQEWQVEREQLQQMIKAATTERSMVESAMNADSNSAKLEAAQNVIQGLRETAESQRQTIHTMEKKMKQLARLAEESQAEALRQQQMEIAQERALLAQQRQELEEQVRRREQSAADETTLKLQVLRQHLNQIHEEERAEKEERKLSSRLARLWRRLDGE
jgi:DNA repair exonuclease SbcCD ATPase subunit